MDSPFAEHGPNKRNLSEIFLSSLFWLDSLPPLRLLFTSHSARLYVFSWIFFFLLLFGLSQSLSVTCRQRDARTEKWQFQRSALWKSQYWTGDSVALIAVRGKMGVAGRWNSWKVSFQNTAKLFGEKSPPETLQHRSNISKNIMYIYYNAVFYLVN